MVKTALLEIGAEEIPTSYIEPALARMKERAEALLKANGLAHGEIKCYATPRRLALLAEKVAEKSEDRTEEFTGPSAKAGKDAAGEFTPAAKGFAAKYGTTPDKLTVKQTDKGEYLCCVKKTPGEKAEKLLAKIFQEMIEGVEFPKSMKWEESGFRFARPVRSIIALYGDKVVKLSAAGVKSSKNTTALHAVALKKVAVASADKYLTALKNACVIADQADRKELILKVVEQAAKRAKGAAAVDEDLLNEVNYLVEHPVVVTGSFSEKFLALPPEVLVTCMRKKQKYFPVTDSKKRLMNCFIGVRNGMSEYQDIVREGYECVLAARLDDAEFFFNKDTKTTLLSKAEKLKGVMFQKELGTVHDKLQRVEKLAGWLLDTLPGGTAVRSEVGSLADACAISKADLVTEMVFEYPELQGVIGRIYAQKDGANPKAAKAAEEHYMPLTADGKLPPSEFGTVLSIADKTDTLVGDFAAGLIPSGSADPYGLRRQAIGVLRMAREKHLRLNISELIEKAFALLPEHLRKNHGVPDQVESFLRQRLEGIFEAAGYRFDEIRAVLSKGALSDIGDLEKRLAALKAVRKQPDFATLITAFKRSANILKQAEKLKLGSSGSVSEAAFREEAEKSLFARVSAMKSEIESLKTGKDYEAVLKKMVEIKPDVDAFFDKVMVMAEDENLKLNRLALLRYATGMFFDLMDFSQLQD